MTFADVAATSADIAVLSVVVMYYAAEKYSAAAVAIAVALLLFLLLLLFLQVSVLLNDITSISFTISWRVGFPIMD